MVCDVVGGGRGGCTDIGFTRVSKVVLVAPSCCSNGDMANFKLSWGWDMSII